MGWFDSPNLGIQKLHAHRTLVACLSDLFQYRLERYVPLAGKNPLGIRRQFTGNSGNIRSLHEPKWDFPKDFQIRFLAWPIPEVEQVSLVP